MKSIIAGGLIGSVISDIQSWKNSRDVIDPGTGSNGDGEVVDVEPNPSVEPEVAPASDVPAQEPDVVDATYVIVETKVKHDRNPNGTFAKGNSYSGNRKKKQSNGKRKV